MLTRISPFLLACTVLIGAISSGAGPCVLRADDARRPNLLIIQTDEHNFRTLGCYRRQLSYEQAHVWGRGVRVETPHIDSLATDGAICTRFYAASPVCTPSRASLMSGLYPQATGSPSNNLPLNGNLVTFAEILRRQGYVTGYVGKWHLDGPAKPGWAPRRKFGFEDNRYMFNRGHWKKFEKTADGARVAAVNNQKKPTYGLDGADEETFSTDFLTSRTLEILKAAKGKPFCVMLSLPDPHGPNTVRAPYDTKYQNFVFQKPASMTATLARDAVIPGWNQQNGKLLKKINQQSMAKYFGMVRCIDDNVGRLLKYLDDAGLRQNTIVVFTSDHGDMMCEHCRLNKGLPYETSARIPFVVRYPQGGTAGKVIKTAYTTADFAPTVLSLMGVKENLPAFHGRNGAADFASAEAEVTSDRVVYIRNAGGRWVAGIDRRFKLVLSTADRPWLFDLEADPDELVNAYNAPEHQATAQRLMKALMAQMKQFKEPALNGGGLKLK